MTPKMPPEYFELRRKQIVEAAWQLFAEKGYRETTVRDLAAKLGVSTGVLYTYFKGKDEIVEALEDRSSGRNEAFYKLLSEEESVRRAIGVILERYADSSRSEEWRIAARANINLIVESLRHEELRESTSALYRESLEMLVKLVERGTAGGEFAKGIDPLVYAHFLSALFLGVQILVGVVKDERVSESVREMTGIILENIWRDRSEGREGS